MSTRIRSQVQGRINPAELQEALMNDPTVQKDIARLEEEVIELSGVSSEQFRMNLEHDYKHDKEL